MRWKPTLGVCLLLPLWLATAQKPTFDVASIKQNVAGREGGTLGPRKDGFFAANVTLENLLLYAYSPPSGLLLRPQILGGPEWIRMDHFDVEAKSPDSTDAIPREQIKAMVQSMLKERFQLKVHHEARDLPVYNLVVMKNGPKLSADQTPPDPRQGFINFASPGEHLSPLPRGAVRVITGPTDSTITGTAISIARLLSLLQAKSDRMIFDKTGVARLVDINLQFNQDLATATPDTGPSLFTAIQEIGLKLQSAKAALEVLVIDSVRKPSPN